MKIERMSLDRKMVLAMPEDERRCLIAFCHMANELAFIQRAMFCAIPDASDQDHSNGQQALFFFQLRTLAGMCFEVWKLIKRIYLKGTIGRENQQFLSADGKASLDALKRVFGRDTLLAAIRNDFASHFSPEKLDERFQESEEEVLLYFEDNHNFNTLYHFAERLVASGIWKLVDGADEFECMMKVHLYVRDVATYLMRFIEEFLSSMVGKHRLNELSDGPHEVSTKGLPALESMRLCWFADTQGIVNKHPNGDGQV